MRITTLNQLKEYTTYTYYKLNKPEYTKKKKVYICQPINYIDEGCTHMDIWSGYIFYKNNAVSRNVGYYGFLLDKESDETYNNIIKKQPKDRVEQSKLRFKTYFKICVRYLSSQIGQTTTIYKNISSTSK